MMRLPTLSLRLIVLIGALALLTNTSITFAGLGHDGGHSHDAPPSATVPAAPRFTAASELFEVVGMLNTKTLVVYVDRFDTNEPITKASIEIEVNGAKKLGALNTELGAFEFAADSFAKPGNYALALTITAEDDIDIVAGHLVVPEMTDDHAHSIWTLKNVGIAAGGLVLLLILVMLVKKTLSRNRTWGTNHA